MSYCRGSLLLENGSCNLAAVFAKEPAPTDPVEEVVQAALEKVQARAQAQAQTQTRAQAQLQAQARVQAQAVKAFKEDVDAIKGAEEEEQEKEEHEEDIGRPAGQSNKQVSSQAS